MTDYNRIKAYMLANGIQIESASFYDFRAASVYFIVEDFYQQALDVEEYLDDDFSWNWDELQNYRYEQESIVVEQLRELYNTHSHFTNGLGMSVINKSHLWNTPDEVEAFRVIWLRRLAS